MNENNGLTQQEIIDFTVVTTEYLEKWQKYPENSLFAGWNWAAFFMTFYWMIFRKMYKMFLTIGIYSLLYVAVISMWNFENIGTASLVVIIILAIAPYIISGLFGTGLYRRKALKVVSQTIDMNENEKKAYLNKKGNTNSTGVWILFGIILGTNILISLSH